MKNIVIFIFIAATYLAGDKNKQGWYVLLTN